MKNTKKEPNPFEKINGIYVIALCIYIIYFLSSSFSWPKAIALAIAMIVAMILLILETKFLNK